MNASSHSISSLLKVLTTGKISSNNKENLLDVEKTAYQLNIPLTNLILEKTSQLKKTPKTAVTAKMTFRSGLDETPLNLDTFSAREGGISQWSNNDAMEYNINEAATGEQNQAVNKIVKLEKPSSDLGKSSEDSTGTNQDRSEILNNEGNQVFPCTYCPKKFAGEEYLELHNKSKHPKMVKELSNDKKIKILSRQKINCNLCDKTFTNPSSLKLHKNIHTKPYKCFKCEKGFSQSGNMRTHMGKCTATQNSISQTESSELDHCEFCKEEFDDAGELETHMVLMHSISEMIQSSELVE